MQIVLSDPDEVRLSKSDGQVYLFYRSDDAARWVCAVVRRLNGDGFLVTAYRASNIPSPPYPIIKGAGWGKTAVSPA